MGYDFLGNYYFGYVFLTGGRGPNRIRLKKIYQPRVVIKFPDTPCCEGVIVLTAKDSESKIIVVWDIGSLVEEEHAILGECPIRRGRVRELRGGNGVVWVSFANVFGELLDIDYVSPRDSRRIESRGAEGRRQLFLGEYRPKVLRINSGVVATSLFKVQIPLTS